MHSRALFCLCGLLGYWRFEMSDVIVWTCDVWILFNTIWAVTLIKLFQLSGLSDNKAKSLIHCTRKKRKKGEHLFSLVLSPYHCNQINILFLHLQDTKAFIFYTNLERSSLLFKVWNSLFSSKPWNCKILSTLGGSCSGSILKKEWI